MDKLGELQTVDGAGQEPAAPTPGDKLWLPYLGETLDAGAATLLAAEAIEAVRFARGTEPRAIKLDPACS